MAPSVCIYTAIFGSYTSLKPPGLTDPHVPMVCFTDDSRTTALGWTVVEVAQRFMHPRYDSKWYRMNPEWLRFVSAADVSIWVDASFQIRNVLEFSEMCVAALDDGDMALFRHPERSNIVSEAYASLTAWSEKYKGQPLLEQAQHYLESGLPKDHSLWAGGIHVRRNGSPVVARANSLWFSECLRWSYQDQISLPYVLWKLGVVPRVIPGNVYEGKNHLWSKGADR